MHATETIHAATAAPAAPPLPLSSRKGARHGLTHGLTSRDAVIACENPAAFEAYRDALIADLRPVGTPEEDLVEAMAMARWKLRRIWRMEGGVYRFWQSKLTGADRTGTYALINDSRKEQALTRLSRFEAQQSRAYLQAEARLRLLQELRRKGLRGGEREDAQVETLQADRRACQTPAPAAPEAAQAPAGEAASAWHDESNSENTNRPRQAGDNAARAAELPPESRMPMAAD